MIKMKIVSSVAGFIILSVIMPLIPGYAQGNIEALLREIRENSARIKSDFTGGEFQYVSTQTDKSGKKKRDTYYFAFSKDKIYIRSYENENSYTVQVKDKSYSVTLEPERSGSNKLVKLVTFSKSDVANNITGRGLLINKKYVCDALGDFSNPRQGTDAKWGDYIEVKSESEFKGDKVRDIYRISREGLVFQQEEEIRRGDTLYIVKDKLLEVNRVETIIIPVASSVEKFRIENGKEVRIRRSDVKVTNLRPGPVDERLFVVEEQPGDRFKDGDSWDYWKVEPDGRRTYIDISNGVVGKNRLVGIIFALSFLLTLVTAATWWVRRKLTPVAAV